MSKNPKFYNPDTESGMQRYQWEDEIIKALNCGYLNNKQVLTLMKLSSAMNWARHKGELRWSNQKACERVGLSQSTFYRNKKEILLSGFLGRKGGNYYAKFPTYLETQTYYRYLEQKILDAKVRQEIETRNSDENYVDPWSIDTSQVNTTDNQDDS
jgi:hypothetical protein